jgi:hypothetical protein
MWLEVSWIFVVVAAFESGSQFIGVARLRFKDSTTKDTKAHEGNTLVSGFFGYELFVVGCGQKAV